MANCITTSLTIKSPSEPPPSTYAVKYGKYSRHLNVTSVSKGFGTWSVAVAFRAPIHAQVSLPGASPAPDRACLTKKKWPHTVEAALPTLVSSRLSPLRKGVGMAAPLTRVKL